MKDTTRRNRAILATGLLAMSLWVAPSLSGMHSGEVLAQSESGSEQKTRKTPAMREKVYKKLAEAQELAEAEDINGAQRILNDLRGQEDMNSYEKAQMWNFFGYIYYTLERYPDAIRAYQSVLEQPDLPEALETGTIYTLAQLSFQTEEYQQAADLLNRWFESANNPGPEAYILLGQAYYQLGRHQDMIGPIETAMDIARGKERPVKENWWLLLRVAYYELENYAKVRDILQTLVVTWPKKEYWTQLAAVYGELDQEIQQLNAYMAAYDQGMLVRSTELVQLSQLFLQAEVPSKAAQVLEKGFEADQVDKTVANYRVLAQALMLAGENAKAVDPLQSAARMSDDGELSFRLAQTYFNLDRYGDAIGSAQDALRKGGLKRTDQAHVIIGMAAFELERFDTARKAFQDARTFSLSRKISNQWITYINNEVARKRQLAEALGAGL